MNETYETPSAELFINLKWVTLPIVPQKITIGIWVSIAKEPFKNLKKQSRL